MTLAFLFWNTFGKSLDPSISRICIERQVDFLLLAESSLTRNAGLLDVLNRKNKRKRYRPIFGTGARGLAVLARHPKGLVEPCQIPSLVPRPC